MDLNGIFTLEEPEGEERRAIHSLVVNTRPHSGALPRLCHVFTPNTLPLLRAEQACTSAQGQRGIVVLVPRVLVP